MTTNTSTPLIAPPGLAGVSVTDTEIGDVRGEEGFFHYRQYDAAELARNRSLEDVWYLLVHGHLPTNDESTCWRARLADMRRIEPPVRDALIAVLQATAGTSDPLTSLRTAISAYGALTGIRPLWDGDEQERRRSALRVAVVVPWLVTAAYAVARGARPRDPRPDLDYVSDYLWMLTGSEPSQAHVTALTRYLCLTVDHGLNASTFTARVIASTGADPAACVVGAIGALSGPLHGGAPSRALDALDEIGSVDRARAWVEGQLAGGRRVMGFGHAVYRGLDPRSELLKQTAVELDTPLARLATQVEDEVVAALEAARPGRTLRANVEYYAGVVMDACGIPREMFTPTFACSRSIGWTTHLLEQAHSRKIFRPSSRYVGPPAPQPLP